MTQLPSKSCINEKREVKENIVHASYEVAYLIAREQKSLGTGEFVKKCIAAAVNKVDPLRLPDYNEISLSRRTITRRIEDIGDNLQQQLEQKVQNFNFLRSHSTKVLTLLIQHSCLSSYEALTANSV